MSSSADLAPLPAEQTTRGSDPALLGREYIGIIKTHVNAHPRSLQTQIGPSELGHACARRIAYKLLGQRERSQEPAWRSTIGTAVHAWLEEAFDADNLARLPHMGQERWLVETRVTVGEVGGIPISGSCDLYDRVTATVIDHKVVSPQKLRDYRASGPGQQYRTQAHLYGRGFAASGHPVDVVMIAFLPRNGELADAHIWHEPYDEQVALDALYRADVLALAVEAAGHEAIDHIPATSDYCGFCPYFRSGSTDLTEGCPGVGQQQPFSDLLAG